MRILSILGSDAIAQHVKVAGCKVVGCNGSKAAAARKVVGPKAAVLQVSFRTGSSQPIH